MAELRPRVAAALWDYDSPNSPWLTDEQYAGHYGSLLRGARQKYLARAGVAAAETLRWAADRIDAEDQAQGVLAPGGEGFDAFRLRAWASELEFEEAADDG